MREACISPDLQVVLGNHLRELQRRVAEFDSEQGGQRMQQHFAQQATAQMPQIACRDPFDGATVDELAEGGEQDGVAGERVFSLRA